MPASTFFAFFIEIITEEYFSIELFKFILRYKNTNCQVWIISAEWRNKQIIETVIARMSRGSIIYWKYQSWNDGFVPTPIHPGRN